MINNGDTSIYMFKGDKDRKEWVEGLNAKSRFDVERGVVSSK